jgi:rubrerythrin
MAKWICTICGSINEGNEPPDSCPVCGGDKSQFEKQED